MARQRYLTLMVHRDGETNTRSVRIPFWLARGLLGFAVAFLILLTAAAIFYAPIARTAARVPGLEQEVARLEAENRQVIQLSNSLERMEQYYDQFRAMLGADLIPYPSSGLRGTPVGSPIFATAPGVTRYPEGPSAPQFEPVPMEGYVTQGLSGNRIGEDIHTGVDVAVPVGTPIRAAGGGLVSQSGYEPEYGMFVLIDHPDGYQSLYGHASRILVSPGQQVQAGEVIGLSGSTGRSTAPHLHFEIRKDGGPIDPFTILAGGS